MRWVVYQNYRFLIDYFLESEYIASYSVGPLKESLIGLEKNYLLTGTDGAPLA